MRAPAIAAAFLLAACHSLQPTPPAEIGLWADAAGAVQDPALAALCVELWDERLAADPFEATRLGDPRSFGRLPDASREGRTLRLATLQELAERTADVDADRLTDEDRITLAMMRAELEWELDAARDRLDEWTVDPLDGPHVELLAIAADQPVDTPRERAQMVERWQHVPRWLKDVRIGQRLARQVEFVASRTAILKTIAQLDAILATDPLDSPLVAPAVGGGRWFEFPPGGSLAELARSELGDGRLQDRIRRANQHLAAAQAAGLGARLLIPAEDDPLTADERGQFFADTLAAVRDDVYPAFRRTRDFLRDDVLPTARPDERPGLVYVPGGAELYRAAVRRHTTLALSPQEIHALGLAEVARIRAEMAITGERLFGTDDVAAIQRYLREDPAMHFRSRDEPLAYAREAVARAQERLPEFFGRLPLAECEVVAVPAHEEPDTTIAYYRAPSAESDRPGRYFVNTYAPETRPRYEAAVLAYHEAIPGHHLQIALASELEDLPRIRRHAGTTAYVEGWALYTERLCDEMGLYDSDVDRLGVLSFDAWRACRLVVDTGLHQFGWSRQQAIDYLFENTLLAANNVENEVDRYIAWPGQALAYKLGQLELLALRDEARAALGEGFSYPAFHDAVLAHGAVTLPELRRLVEAWIELELAAEESGAR